MSLILVVDDSAYSRKKARLALRDEGYEIETFLSTPLETISLHFQKYYAPAPEIARTALSRLEQYPEILRQGRRLIKNPPKIEVESALEGMPGARGNVQWLAKESDLTCRMPVSPCRAGRSEWPDLMSRVSCCR